MPIIRPQQTDYGIKEAADALQGGVSVIGSIFKDRYDRKQYEDFLAGPGKDYQDQMKSAQDMLLDHTNPDAAQQAVNTLKNATNDFMDNATRFGDNPYIMAKAKRVWDGHMSFIKDEFTAKLQDAKVQTEQAKAENEKTMGPLNQKFKQSQIDLNNAKAANENAKAGNPAGGKGAIQYLSGDPAKLAEIADPEKRADAAYSNVIGNMDLPASDPKRKAMDTGVKQELFEEAKQRVAAKQARNETRPVYKDDEGNVHGGDKWDAGNPDHVKYMAGMVDPTVAKDRFAIKAIRGESGATGVDADIIDRKYGAIVDPTRATPANPVTRPLADDELGKVLLGTSGWSDMRALVTDDKGQPVLNAQGRPQFEGVTNVKSAVKLLPDKYDDMKKSPLTDAVDNAVKEMTARVKSGNLKITEQNVNTYLKRTMVQDVIGPLIGGAGAETASLPEGLKRNRIDGKALADAIADRYSKQLYNRIMGIQEKEAPQPQEQPQASSPVLIGRDALKNLPLINELSGRGIISKVQGATKPGKK